MKKIMLMVLVVLTSISLAYGSYRDRYQKNKYLKQISKLVPDPNDMFYFDGSEWQLCDSNDYGRGALAMSTAALFRTYLGVDPNMIIDWTVDQTPTYQIDANNVDHFDLWDLAYGWGDHSAQNYFDIDVNTLDDIPDGTTYKLLTASDSNNLRDGGGTTLHTHNLDNITDGTSYKLLSAADSNNLRDSGNTTLHYHAADRARANHTGTQAATTIIDFNDTVALILSQNAEEPNQVLEAIFSTQDPNVGFLRRINTNGDYDVDPNDYFDLGSDTLDEVPDGTTYKLLTAADSNDLRDGEDTILHYHSADRARANHTGTQLASTISDPNQILEAMVAGFNPKVGFFKRSANDDGNWYFDANNSLPLPEDPDADMFLFWDDGLGIVKWVVAPGGGDMLRATYDVAEDGFVDGNDVVYSSAWNGDVNAPSMNSLYGYLHQLDPDDSGSIYADEIPDFNEAVYNEPNVVSAYGLKTTLDALDGIIVGNGAGGYSADINDYKDRSIHTGTQLSTTISDFDEAVYNEPNVLTAYNHSQVTSGNPHSVTPAELGLVIGTDVEAHDPNLTGIADAPSTYPIIGLIDDPNAAEARNTLKIPEQGLVTMTYNGSAWIVREANGVEVDISGSTTGGLQEAINAAEYNVGKCGLEIRGNAVIDSSDTITFPAMQGTGIQWIGGGVLNFNSGIGSDTGIVIDSAYDSVIHFDAIIAYTNGIGNVIEFKPTNPVPVDNITAIWGTTYFFKEIAVPSDANVGVHFNTTNATIANGNTFIFNVIDGGKDNLIKVDGGKSFTRNIIVAPYLKATTCDINSPCINLRAGHSSGNDWFVKIDANNGQVAIDCNSSGDKFYADIVSTMGTDGGIICGNASSKNQFYMGQFQSGLFTDNSSVVRTNVLRYRNYIYGNLYIYGSSGFHIVNGIEPLFIERNNLAAQNNKWKWRIANNPGIGEILAARSLSLSPVDYDADYAINTDKDNATTPAFRQLANNAGIMMIIKTGINQAAAGANPNELWADTDNDYIIKLGH